MAGATSGNPRPKNQEGNAHAAFIAVLLATTQWGVVGVRQHSPVVRVQNQVGVLNELVARIARVIGLFQISDHLTDHVIDGVDHAGIIGVDVAWSFA